MNFLITILNSIEQTHFTADEVTINHYSDGINFDKVVRRDDFTFGSRVPGVPLQLDTAGNLENEPKSQSVYDQ